MEDFNEQIIKDVDKIVGERFLTNNTVLYDKFTDFIEIEFVDEKEKNLILFKHSIKLANINFNFKEAVAFINSNALALGMSWESLSPWKIVLLIICDLFELASKMIIKLDANMVGIVKFIDSNKGMKTLYKKEIYEHFNNLSHQEIDESLTRLVEIKVIEMDNDKVILKEKAYFKKVNKWNDEKAYCENFEGDKTK